MIALSFSVTTSSRSASIAKVDRIGDGAGDVFGHRSSDRQIAVGEAAEFIEQAHDCRLVLLRLLRLQICRFAHIALPVP